MTYDEILKRITVTEAGCWEWTGAHLSSGYGSVRFAGRTRVLHHVTWEHANGRPVPKPLQIDHLCRNRRCCNPDHLEPVTHAENLRRGKGFGGVNSRKTACLCGRPYDLIDTRGYRDCSTCKKERKRQWDASRRTAEVGAA